MSIVSNPNKPGRRKGANKTRVWFYSAECRYDVVLERAKKFGWKLVSDEKNEHNCNFYWIDSATIHERFKTILPWQVINHFPGMPNIARKNRMGQNLNRMQKIMPAEYNFYPRTWVLPGEFTDFEKNFDSQGNSNKIFIIKPDSGCQGRGIFLTKSLSNIPRTENVVAQVYIKRPMVIDDFKFDLRIYVYVSSVRPLRMYLFHDGLVRMCTEKYVKPTKQNLDNTCMHLTNYAVNKNASGFNQPTAASSDNDFSGQEDAHKRSLLWFMNFVRQKYGDAKADWLWRRIGILCVRTLMSIMPVLSRDYQQYFKSFGHIPTDIDSIRKGGGDASAAVNGSSTARSVAASASSSKDCNNKSNSGNNTAASNGADTEDEEENERNGAAAAGGAGTENESDAEGSGTHDRTDGDHSGASGTGAGGTQSTGPDPDVKMRGSRAFEVLGFDIMLDDKLKPWLIEVNHLPSFGTESPLDLDIKSRLMEQVFNTLPVRMDDEQAYQAYHQFESEKRLRKGRSDPSIDGKEDKKGGAPRSKSLDRNGGSSGDGQGQGQRERKSQQATADAVFLDPVAAAEAEEARLEKERGEREQYELKEREYLLSAQNKALEALAAAAATAAQALCRGAEMPHFAFTTALDSLGEVVVTTLISENDTQYRLLEINEILAGVYEQYCPEKISKIDRLLCKYQGREEEFLQFVVQKYSVGESLLTNIIECVLPKYHPITIPAFTMKKTAAATAAADPRNGDSTDGAEDGEGNSKGGSMTGGFSSARKAPNMVPRPPDKNKAGGGTNGGSTLNNNAKRNSRSLSPPGAGSSSRAQASWKGGSAEEEEAFKEEVLAAHVPSEEDEWLQFESKYLHQFTRIFPVVEPTKTATGSGVGATLSEQEAAELEAREEEEEANEDKNEDEKAKDKEKDKDKGEAAASVPPKTKIASYTEIMHQVFVADRRQTMRFHVPLGGARRAAEAAADKDGSLPPLHEPFRAGNANSSSLNKPGPGWRAPVYKPPTQEKKNLVPTQSQVDVAKRLTQGMSSAPLPYGSKSQKQQANNAANQGHYAFQFDRSDDEQSLSGGGAMGQMAMMGQMGQQMGIGGVIATTGLNALGNSSSIGQDMSMHPRISKYVVWCVFVRTFVVLMSCCRVSELCVLISCYCYCCCLLSVCLLSLPSPYSLNINRLVEESRQARLRLEQSKSTAASVLRQQVFHFDPVAASAAAGQATNGQGSTPQLLQLGIGGVGQTPGMGTGVPGSGSGGQVNGGSAGGTTRFGNNVRLVQEQLQRQNGAAGGTGPGLTGGSGSGSGSTRIGGPGGGRITDEHAQEEMLRSYFPGWF